MTRPHTQTPLRTNPAQDLLNEVFCRRITSRECSGEGLRLEREFFFGLVENGTARVRDRAGERPLRAGELLILSPSRSCTLEHPDAGFRLLGVRLTPDFFDTLPDGQPMYSQLARCGDTSRAMLLRPDPTVWEPLRRTAALFANGTAPYTTCRRGIVRHWCGLFLLQVTEILQRDNDRPSEPLCVKRADLLFRAFKRLSVENYLRHHDLGFYADALHISPTYLSRIVKRTTGHTVYAHLAGLLCAEARRYLESTDTPIKEIADRLGFADQSAFGKFFKSQTGVSPSEHRQRFGRPAENSPQRRMNPAENR